MSRGIAFGIIALLLVAGGCDQQARGIAPDPPDFDLSGVWDGNDGGTYYIQMNGNDFWWYGESPDDGSTWANVFSGVAFGTSVEGPWSDVPPGQSQNNGALMLHVTDENHFRAVGDHVGFGGSEWVRKD